MTHSRTFIFAGGGTGGHIFPALAIAEQLRAADPGAAFLYLVSSRPLDAEVLAARGERFVPLPARPLLTSPLGVARFVGSWGPSVRAARGAIREAQGRGPHLVAMGGFVCPPAVQAARAQRVPVSLVNLDAVPGLANRWAARRAGRVLTSAPVPGRRWEAVGPIVRAQALPGGTPGECRRRLGLDPDRPTLFVSGGSQGARSINRFMAAFARAEGSALAGWQVIHQTGPDAEGGLAEAYAAGGTGAMVVPFLTEVGLAWGAADLAVARAGAGSVAEAWASRTPTVFLPYPHHADEHQRANARPLEAAGGAVVVTDRIDPEANLAEHGAMLAALLSYAQRREAMRGALAGLGPADGAARVAAALLDAG